jgi:hypothetical protein
MMVQKTSPIRVVQFEIYFRYGMVPKLILILVHIIMLEYFQHIESLFVRMKKKYQFQITLPTSDTFGHVQTCSSMFRHEIETETTTQKDAAIIIDHP